MCMVSLSGCLHLALDSEAPRKQPEKTVGCWKWWEVLCSVASLLCDSGQSIHLSGPLLPL